MNYKTKSKKSFSNSKLLFTLVSIILGLLVGALVLSLTGYHPLEAYGKLIEGIFKSPRNIGWALVNSTPIILTGLGVCFAFQTGLFNIGALKNFPKNPSNFWLAFVTRVTFAESFISNVPIEFGFW